MSLADVRSASGVMRRRASARSVLSARFFRSELAMVFRRRRNHALLVVLAGRAGPHRDRDQGQRRQQRRQRRRGALFGSITDNGVFVAFSALFVVIPLFLPMADGGRGRRRRVAARRTSARCATCSPSRSGAPGCSPSSSPGIVVWCLACCRGRGRRGRPDRAHPVRRRRRHAAVRYDRVVRRRAVAAWHRRGCTWPPTSPRSARSGCSSRR